MFKEELDQIVELGVIISVKEPTELVSSIVLRKTTIDNGVVTKLSVCLDPRDLNKWVKREHHYTKASKRWQPSYLRKISSVSSMRRSGIVMSQKTNQSRY